MSPHTDPGALLKLAADLDECSFKPNVNSRFVGARDLMKRAAVVIRQAASQGSAGGERSEVLTGDAVAWQFRQRSGVGKGSQSHAPWGDWCGIEKEDYDIYVARPNRLIEVRALYASAAQAPGNPVARAHISLQDDGPYAELEVLNGELLQPFMSPVDLYAAPVSERFLKAWEIERVLYEYFRTGEPGETEAIKSAAAELSVMDIRAVVQEAQQPCSFCGYTYGRCLSLETAKYCRTSSVPSAHREGGK